MNRRTFLATSGVLGLAGCLGRGSADGGDGGDADGPELESREFSRTGQCDEPGTAGVTFGESEVRVVGCIQGRNGCMQASLRTATYDRETDRLRVVVETVDESGPDEVCTEALVNRGYEARFGFAGGLPATVVVVHDNLEGETEVVRQSR